MVARKRTPVSSRALIVAPAELPLDAVVEIPSAAGPAARRGRKKVHKFDPPRKAGSFDKCIDELLRLLEVDPNNPEMSKSKEMRIVLDDMIDEHMQEIGQVAFRSSRHNKRSTITLMDVKMAVGNVYNGELATSAKRAGEEALALTVNYSRKDGTRARVKANLSIDPSRAEKILRCHSGEQNLNGHASTYTAAAVERVFAEMMAKLLDDIKEKGLKRLRVSHLRSLLTVAKSDAKGACLADIPTGDELFICD